MPKCGNACYTTKADHQATSETKEVATATIQLPVGEKTKTTKDRCAIASNLDIFVAIIDHTAIEGVSSPPYSSHVEGSFDLDKAARELHVILEDATLPPMITPLAPSPTDQGEDSFTLDTSMVIEENMGALRELLGRARMSPGERGRNTILYICVHIIYLPTVTPAEEEEGAQHS